MTRNRLPPPHGRLIDRDRTVRFTFEGRPYEGFAGDTIASALAANDVWLLSRSFKYHRPRGVLTMSGDDGNTLVQLPDEPNVLADIHPIAEGLAVSGQHYRGSLLADSGQRIERFGRFLPVGFYYRAFFRPRGVWKLWEKVIRRRAGLGRVNPQAAHRYYDKTHAFADVAVIGGGAAGMAAALAAAEAGREVVLVERMPFLGGALAYARIEAETGRTETLLRDLTARIAAAPRITVMTEATATGCFADNLLSVMQGDRMIKLRAGSVVVATGALDQPMVFRNNDLPGIMVGSAAERLIGLYGVRPGRRAVVATANGAGYGAALALLDAGVQLASVLDLNDDPATDPRRDAVSARGISILAGHAVREALPDAGGNRIGAVVAAPVTTPGKTKPRGLLIGCDLLCISMGRAPAAALIAHAGGTISYDEQAHSFVLRSVPEGVQAAGAVNGAWQLDAALADGRRAGRVAAGGEGWAPPAPAERGDAGSHPWPIFPHRHGKEFVDFDEDLTIADIADSVAEGFDDIELVKRFSTVGMGPSQGRLSTLNAVRLTSRITGRPFEGARGWTNRPPVVPEKFGQLAGRGFDPVRLTPMYDRHLEAGAETTVAGAWLRPAWYGSSRDAAIAAEIVAVRRNVGLIDVSTLGGFAIRGPDAAEFLNRIYTGAFAQQPVGRARYALMCDATGTILDDGVACRLAADHFYVTATTGNADAVWRQMLWWNAQWRLEIDIANITAAYAAVNIAGPQSRRVLATLCRDIDLSPQAFPYMAVRQGMVADIPALLMRVGFVGELGYEIHVPASQGEALWDALIAAGTSFGIRPFGVEAQRILRLEKGHVIVGQDTDGLTYPHEAGMEWAISRGKPFFLGGRAIAVHNQRGLKRRLVGFTLVDPTGPMPEECHLVIRDGKIVGRVTSIARSPTLGWPIGLAYVAPDQAALGSRFTIKGSRGRSIAAEVTRPPFYDPDNRRQEL